jgi:hypothetical protein
MRDETSKPPRAIYSSKTTTQQVDASTGEVLTRTDTEKVLTKKDGTGTLTFTKMFYMDLCKLYGLKKSAMMLFIELGGMIDDDKNNIIITPAEREKISKRTGLNTQVIYNATRELVSSGLLVRIINSVYMIDPGIFAVGSDPKVIENRKKFNDLQKINMQVHYTKDGRKIEVSLE